MAEEVRAGLASKSLRMVEGLLLLGLLVCTGRTSTLLSDKFRAEFFSLGYIGAREKACGTSTAPSASATILYSRLCRHPISSLLTHRGRVIFV